MFISKNKEKIVTEGISTSVTKKDLFYITIFLSPALFFLTLFTFWPLVYTFKLSFYKWNMVSPHPKWTGLNNYLEILKSREFLMAFWQTIEYTFIFFILIVVLPYIFAYVVNYRITRGQSFYRSLFFAPSTLSLAVASVIFLWIYNPITGPINTLLEYLNLPAPSWLNSYGWVILALAFITAWKTFGYNFIILLAGMLAIPHELIEAAILDNVPHWKIFWKIIRPLTSATSLFVFVTSVIMGAQYVFVPIQMLTNGGPDQGSTNLVFLTYEYAFNFFQAGKASASAIITLIIFGSLLILQWKVLERKVYYEN